MSQLFAGGQSIGILNPSDEYSGLISFKIDWFDLLAVQGTLKSFPQHHNSKASTLWHSIFFIVQLSHPYMTTGKNHSFDYTKICQQSDMKWAKKKKKRKKSDSHIKRPFIALALFLFSLRFSLLKCTWWCLTLKVNVSSWECKVLTAVDNKILQKPSYCQRNITTSTHDFSDLCIYLLNQF